MAHPPSPRRKRSKRSRPRKQVAKAKKKAGIGFGEGGYGRGGYDGSISSGPIAALEGTGGLSATPDVLPAPISIFPTVYPQEPSGTITVQNYITINVHGADFHTLENTMGQLLAEMPKSNAIAGEVRDKLIAEINAGMTILKSPKPTRGLIDLLLVRPLKYIAEKAAGATIGGLAGAALKVLLRMMGLG
jgi:hypothetical protein